MEAKIRRHQHLQETRQTLVLAAARSVVARLGLERTSMREIAREAGYTAGALYAHFDGKQALLVALLDQTLDQLEQSVQTAKPLRASPEQAFLQQGEAWIVFLMQSPVDLELLLHFLSGRGQVELAGDTAARGHLHIRQTLDALAQALLAQGQDAAQVEAEIEALLAQGIGLLMAQDGSHVPTAVRSPKVLFESYLRRLWASTQLRPDGAGQGAVAQVDLFG